jgi:hypothetical protein
VHTACYGADCAYFSTTLNEGAGLTAKPGDAKPGWTCETCRLQAVLGRQLDLRHSATDVALYESALMYQVDIGNNIVGSTATNYTQGAAAFTNWMDVFMPTATYLETDEPRAPPRQDRLYALGVHQEFISSNLYTRGVRSGGGGVVASTALKRVSCLRHLGSAGGDIERELRHCSEFRRQQLGMKKRLLDNPQPKLTCSWQCYERWLADYRREWRGIRKGLREWGRRRGESGRRAGLRRQQLRLREVHVLGMMHLLHIMVFGYTRGRVPFRLRQAAWRRGLWTTSRCLRHGVLDTDGHPMPHMRLLRTFRTKTHSSAWYEGVMAAVTASGHQVLATAVSLEQALLEAGLTGGGLFFDDRGVELDLARWQETVMRPELRRMRAAGEPSLRDATDGEFKRRWSSWSFRRLAETHFSCASVGIPMCPRDLKIGHSGWAEDSRVRGHISDRYRCWPLSHKIDATRLYA